MTRRTRDLLIVRYQHRRAQLGELRQRLGVNDDDVADHDRHSGDIHSRREQFEDAAFAAYLRADWSDGSGIACRILRVGFWIVGEREKQRLRDVETFGSADAGVFELDELTGGGALLTDAELLDRVGRQHYAAGAGVEKRLRAALWSLAFG